MVTIGTFDGVHLGHQKIIRRVLERAVESDGESVLLTFFPHPRMILYPDDHGLKLLNTMEEKVALLDKYGIGHLVVHPFTLEFSRTSVTAYVRDLLVNGLGTKKLVIGYDHHFGRNREGSLADLRELSQVYGFSVEEIPEQDIDDVAISSTKIRNALLEGDVQTALEFMGHAYTVSGTVAEGRKLGRKLGFPTANIEVPEPYKLIPASGIYAAKVILEDGREYNAAVSIGKRPTFEKDGATTVEVYLMEFEGNLYGQKLTLSFLHRLRDEIKYDNTASLVSQMKKDVEMAKRLLSA